MPQDLALSILISAQDQASGIIAGLTASFGPLGAAMTAATAAAASFGVQSVQSAGQYQQLMTKVQTLAAPATENINQMSQALLQMSANVGQSPQKLADGLYYVESAGFHGQAALNLLDLSAKAAAVGMTDTMTIANAATSAINAYGKEHLAASTAVDMMTKTVASGKMEFSQYANVVGLLATTANTAKVSFAEMNAGLAVMTNSGMTAQRASVYLQNTLSMFGMKADALAKNADKLGLSFNKTKFEAMDFGQKIQYLDQVTHGNADAALHLFGNNSVVAKSFETLKNHASDYASTLDTLKHSQGSTEQAFQQASQTYAVSSQQLSAAFQVLQIELGSALLPMLTKIVQYVTGAVTAFNGWESQTHFMENALSAVGSAIQGVINVGAGILQWLTQTQAGAATLIIAIGALGGVLALFAASAVADAILSMIEFALSMVTGAAEAVQSAIVMTTTFGEMAGMITASLIPAVAELLVTLAPFIAIGAAIALVITGIVLAVQNWSAVTSVITSVWQGIASFFSGLVNNAVTWGSNLVIGFANGISSAIGAVISAITSVVNAVANFIGFASPSKEGPGKDLDKWGPNMVKTFGKGIQDSDDHVQRAVGTVAQHLKAIKGDDDDDDAQAKQKGQSLVQNVAQGISENVSAIQQAASAASDATSVLNMAGGLATVSGTAVTHLTGAAKTAAHHSKSAKTASTTAAKHAKTAGAAHKTAAHHAKTAAHHTKKTAAHQKKGSGSGAGSAAGGSDAGGGSLNTGMPTSPVASTMNALGSGGFTGGLTGKMQQAGATMMTSLGAGITSKISAVTSAFGNVGKAVQTAWGNVLKGVQTLWNNAVSAIEAGVNNIGSWMSQHKTVVDAFAAAISGVGAALIYANSGPILGFIASLGKMAVTMSGTVVAAIGDFLAWLGTLDAAMLVSAGTDIMAFLATIPELVAGFAAWAVGAGAAAVATIAATWPLLAIGAAVAAVVFGIIMAVQHWGAIVSWLRGVWQAFATWFMGIWNSFTHIPAIAAFGNFIKNIWNGIVSSAQSAWGKITAGAQSAWANISEKAKGIAPALKSAWSTVQSDAQSLWAKITVGAGNAWDSVSKGAQTLWSVIAKTWAQGTAGIMPQLSQAMNAAKSQMSQALAGIMPALNNLWNSLKQIGQEISGAFLTAWKALQPVFASIGASLRGAFAGAWKSLLSVFAQVGQAFAQIGAALAQVGKIIGGAFMSTWKALQPVLAQIAQVVGGALASAWKALSPILAKLWQQFGSQLLTALEIIGGVIGGVILLAISLLLGLLVGLAQGLATLIQGLMKFFSGLVQFFSGIVQIITGIVTFIIDLVTGHFDKLGTDLGTIWTGIKTMFGGIWLMIQGIFQASIGTIIAIVSGLVTTVINFFTNLYNTLVGHSIIPDLCKAIIASFTGLFAKVISGVTTWVQGVINWFTNLWKMAQILFTVYTIYLEVLLLQTWHKIWTDIQTVWTNIWKWVQQWWTILQNYYVVYTTYLIALLLQTWNKIQQDIKTLWTNIKTIFSTAWNTYILTPLTNIKNNLTNWFSNLATMAVTWGKNLIQGFINGINAMAGQAASAAQNIATQVSNFIGHHSPAKEGPGKDSDDWGPNLIKSFAKGIDDRAEDAAEAARKVASKVKQALTTSAATPKVSIVNGIVLPNYATGTGYNITNTPFPQPATSTTIGDIHVHLGDDDDDDRRGKKVAEAVKKELAKHLRHQSIAPRYTSGGTR